MRAAIFLSLERFLRFSEDDEDTLKKVCEKLKCPDILADGNEENCQAYLKLLVQLTGSGVQPSVVSLLDSVIGELRCMFHAESAATRELFYELCISIWDNLDEFKARVKPYLVHGLDDAAKPIRVRLEAFWDDEARMSAEPTARLQQLFDDLYEPSEEHIWLVNATHLLLQTATQSP